MVATKKMSGLKAGLEKARGPVPVLNQKPSAAAAIPVKEAGVRENRQDREILSAWLPAEFKHRIRQIQGNIPDRKIQTQDLVAEALNDLFEKYGVERVKL